MVMHCPLGTLSVNVPGCSCSHCLSAVFSFRPDTFVGVGGGWSGDCQSTLHSKGKKYRPCRGGGGICCGADVGKNHPFFYMVMEKGVVDLQ